MSGILLIYWTLLGDRDADTKVSLKRWRYSGCPGQADSKHLLLPPHAPTYFSSLTLTGVEILSFLKFFIGV